MRTKLLRCFPVLLAVLLFGAAELYAQTATVATVVTHSGQRIRGQVVNLAGNGNYSYDSDTVVLRVNGRNRRIPVRDVALIDFAGNGDVSQNELNRASRSSDGFMVLRNGRTLDGRVVDFQGFNNQAVVAGQFGQRTIALSQVARMYFGNGSAAYNDYSNNNQVYDPYGRNVYGNYGSGNDAQYGQYGQPSYGRARSVTIPANQTWSNSGIDVRRGDVIHFRANGRVSLSQNPGDVGTPAGADDGRLAGNSPLPGLTGGMLIGRVANSQPFAIGAESDVTMPANGRLYLGVNDDYSGDNSGNFAVEMFPR